MTIPNKIQCRLCKQFFDNKEMSEEHYPARSVGNDDIVALDILKLFDSLMSDEHHKDIIEKIKDGQSYEKVMGDYFDTELSKSLYPKGRTARTLCRQCNTFLGNYDKAYLKFYNKDGNPNVIKGFQKQTKHNIIKSILGKFLSVPETANESFDFIDYLKDETSTEYHGKWRLYFVKRDYSTDLMGFGDLGTGKITYDEGVVYEFSDEKFIFNLMNFPKHDSFKMTNFFDILNNHYTIVEGCHDDIGGYHAMIMMSRLFPLDKEDIL